MAFSLTSWVSRAGIVRRLVAIAGPAGHLADLNPSNAHNVTLGGGDVSFSVPVKLRVGTGGGTLVFETWAGNVVTMNNVQDGERFHTLARRIVDAGTTVSDVTAHHSLDVSPII